MTPADPGRAGTAPAAVPAVAVENLHVAWDANLVLHGVSFSIPAGQTVALTGSNGSGKSTLLHAILGTAPITRGSACVFGIDNAKPSQVPWHRIGYVPQRLNSSGAITASSLETVLTGTLGRRKWWTNRKDEERAMNALKRVGLAHRAKDPLAILSGGQAQRVLIARAMVRNPELLIMDEPMAGIDRASRERLAEIVTEAKDAGTTILVVLHELGELAPLLDREIRISRGHLDYDGPARPEGEHRPGLEDCHHRATRPPVPPSFVDGALKEKR